MHSDADLPPDDGNPDWPDNWPPPAPPEPGSRWRGPRIAALTLTVLVALGAGAGAVYVYQSGLAGATPAASAVQGGTVGPVSDGGTVRVMLLLGLVRAVGRDTVTLGGGPVPDVSAQVTSATLFSGSARSFGQVHVGDTVAVQITGFDRVARVVSLQDRTSH